MLLKWLARLAGFREGLTRRYYRVASFSRCEEGFGRFYAAGAFSWLVEPSLRTFHGRSESGLALT
jgi:hypothetical protein